MLFSNYQKIFSLNSANKLTFLEFFFSSLVYITILSVFILFTLYLIYNFKKSESASKENEYFSLVFKFLLKFFFFLF